MIIELERYSLSETETEGVLSVGSKKYATIEPSLFRKKYGAVPPGDYLLVPHNGQKYKNVFALLADDERKVHPTQRPDSKRVAILIHAANLASELKGCIAPGLKRGFIRLSSNKELQPAVINSKTALDEINAVIRAAFDRGENVILRIKHKVYSGA